MTMVVVLSYLNIPWRAQTKETQSSAFLTHHDEKQCNTSPLQKKPPYMMYEG